MKRKKFEKIILYIAVFVMVISPWTTALAEMDMGMTTEEERGSFLLLKADGEEMGGSGVIRLNLEIANRKKEDIHGVSFNIEDPEDILQNEDELAGELPNFYAKTIKGYSFVVRLNASPKDKTYPLFLVMKTSNGIQKIPFTLNVGPKGLTGRLYSPSSRTPQGVKPESQGKLSMQFANKGQSNIEDFNIKVKSLNKELTITNPEIKVGDIPSNRFEKIDINYIVGNPVSGDYLPIMLELNYRVDGVEYTLNQFRVLDPTPVSDDLGDSSNWNREQMRRAASGEIPPSGGDIPDESGNNRTPEKNPVPDNGGDGGGSSGGSTASTRNKPKLIISKYTFSKKPVIAGETFQMELTFFNTNANKKVKNIKIFLTSDEASTPEGQGQSSRGGSVFTPVDSSNTFYIDEIGAKSTVSKTISLSAEATAAAKNYTMVANFEYEDGEGNEFTAKELIGIPVVQKSRLTTSEITLPEMAFTGQPVPVGIDFYNTGKVTLYNLFVNVEGDFSSEGQNQYFVGNFTSGSQDHYESNIIPNKTGENKGKIVFTYEDAAGNPQKVEKEITINAQEMMNMPQEGDDMTEPMPEQSSKPIYKQPVFYIVLAVVGGLVIYVLIRRKNKQKEDELKLHE